MGIVKEARMATVVASGRTKKRNGTRVGTFWPLDLLQGKTVHVIKALRNPASTLIRQKLSFENIFQIRVSMDSSDEASLVAIESSFRRQLFLVPKQLQGAGSCKEI